MNRIVAAAAIAVLLVVFGGVWYWQSQQDNVTVSVDSDRLPADLRTVSYEIDGRGRATITMAFPEGTVTQENARLPWKSRDVELAVGDTATVTVDGGDPVFTQCGIRIDGAVPKAANSPTGSVECTIVVPARAAAPLGSSR